MSYLFKSCFNDGLAEKLDGKGNLFFFGRVEIGRFLFFFSYMNILHF